jgi:hypothetical protein
MMNLTDTFYISLFSYFKDDLPNRRDSIRMWELLNIFSEYQCKADYWIDGNAIPRKKYPSIQIGDIALMSRIEGQPEQSICGGGFTPSLQKALVTKPYGYDFYYALSSNSRWYGLDIPGYAHAAFTCDWINEENENLIISTLLDYLEICDKYLPLYAMIDVSHYFNSYCGLSFGSISVGDLALDRRIEQYRWLKRVKEQRNPVRGIYWGNYLSNRMFRHEDSKREFIEKYDQFARYSDGEQNAIIYELKNGTFFSLSKKLTDSLPERIFDLVLGRNACYFVDLLAEHNLYSQ